MFQFPQFPSCFQDNWLQHQLGCPIRTSLDHQRPALPQGFSQRGHVLHRQPAPRHPPCAHHSGLLAHTVPRSPQGPTRVRRSLLHHSFLLAREWFSRPSTCQGAGRQRWSRGGSNPEPPPCKGGALPIELRPRTGGRAWIRTRDLGLIRAAL